MTICFVTIEYNGKHGGGGIASYIYTLGVELTKMGHRVIVITKGRKKHTSKEGGIELHSISLGDVHYYLSKIPILQEFALSVRELEWSFSFGRKLCEITRIEKIDVIESCETGNFWAMMMRPDIPWIIRVHGSTYSFKKHSSNKVGLGEKLDRWLQLYCMRKAAAISAPSRFQANEISAEIKGKKVKVIPNPVSQNFSEKRHSTRANKTRKQVLYTGRLAEVKGILPLIEAAALVCKKINNVEFILAGPYHTSIPEKKIRSLIKNKQLADKAHLVGPVSWNKIGEYYKKCDVFVMPSFFESFCISAIEAMACSKPLVTSRVGALPEIVEDDVTGLLVEPGNSLQLADALCRLLSDEELCMMMGKAGKKKVLESYGSKKVAEQTLTFYESVR